MTASQFDVQATKRRRTRPPLPDDLATVGEMAPRGKPRRPRKLPDGDMILVRHPERGLVVLSSDGKVSHDVWGGPVEPVDLAACEALTIRDLCAVYVQLVYAMDIAEKELRRRRLTTTRSPKSDSAIQHNARQFCRTLARSMKADGAKVDEIADAVLHVAQAMLRLGR